LTRSLHRMRSTCLQIVPVHALRMMPISRFVLPCAIQVRTSVSRAVSPNEPSGFFTSISLVFVLILGFLFLCGAFIWLLIFCQHEQSWGKLYDSWCIGVSGPCSAGGKLFGLRLVLVIENSFPGGPYWMRLLCAVMAHVKKNSTMAFCALNCSFHFTNATSPVL